METRRFTMTDKRVPQKLFEESVDAAAAILRNGGLLAIPTETVYGLGANGLDPEAVGRIFQAKGRPQDNPLILHLAGPHWLERYCAEVPPLAYLLAKRFWPGPLTMVLKRKPIVPDVTTAGLDTVAVRCPDHPVTLAILRAAAVPVAAPSANLSGRPSCTSAADVLEDMEGKIDGIVDGGPCCVGVESTILDLTCQPPRLLRPGGLALEELESVVGKVEVDRAVSAMLEEGEKPRAPGMKYRHYAPQAPVTVVTGKPERTAKEIAVRMRRTSGIICFDEFRALFDGHEVHSLGPLQDKITQAQRVFEALRTFDSSDVTEIYAQCPDTRGLGLAVGNRLKKAAGFQIIDTDHKKVVVGFTGGSGAGKTSALRALERLGGRTLDCDAVYYEMLRTNESLREELQASFGDIFLPDGALDRQKLGSLVFGNEQRLGQLNDIIFRYMPQELERRMARAPAYLYGLDAINLIESGVNKLCDRTVAVTTPMELRLRRIMERDNITEEYARLRLGAQKPDSFYREGCTSVLENTAASAAQFEERAYRFLERLVEEIKEEKRNV